MWNLAALAIGIAALASGMALGMIWKAWLEGLSRNPEASGKMFVPAILALAFSEAVAIYGFVIASQLISK